MKTVVRESGIILVVLACLISCKEIPTLPIVTTAIVTEISQTSAISGGIVAEDGDATVIQRGICWNTSEEPTTDNTRTLGFGGLGSFADTLTSLIPDRKYYVRAYAMSEVGTAYGEQVSFSTSSIALPKLSTEPITSITSNTAISGGTIIDDGGDVISAKGICWGTEANPTIADANTNEGIGVGAFTSKLTGLTSDIQYYVRAYATNSAGIAYGNEQSFTIHSTSPVYVGSTVENATPTLLEITFSLPLANIVPEVSLSIHPDSLSFIIRNDNLNLIASSASISGSKVLLTLYELNPVIFGHNLTVSYAKPTLNPLQTSSGEQVPSFNAQVVSNNVGPLNSAIIFNPNLTYGSVGDIDGNLYKTIQIGTQTWMAENLKTTKFNDGTEIQYCTDSAEWDFLVWSPGFCYFDDDPSTYKNTYGALYNFYAVVDSRNLCPADWHVPTDEEWHRLILFLDPSAKLEHLESSIAGGKLNEIGTTHWWNSGANWGVTNETGFTALPGGYRNYNGVFYPYSTIGTQGYWWSSSAEGVREPNFAWLRSIMYTGAVERWDYPGSAGYSVRCVKD